MTTATITIQIGNSDDKLTQEGWATFVKATQEEIDLFWAGKARTHFSGGSLPHLPWQNYCWVIKAPAENLVATLQRWRSRLGELARDFFQDSIAMTVGKTEFVKAVP